MADEPRPASFENALRLIPQCMASLMPIPAAPPLIARGLKADIRIEFMAWGSFWAWHIKTVMEANMKITLIIGTNISAVLPTLLAPPEMILKTKIANKIPRISLSNTSLGDEMGRNSLIARKTAATPLFICTMLPMPMAEIAANKA